MPQPPPAAQQAPGESESSRAALPQTASSCAERPVSGPAPGRFPSMKGGSSRRAAAPCASQRRTAAAIRRPPDTPPPRSVPAHQARNSASRGCRQEAAAPPPTDRPLQLQLSPTHPLLHPPTHPLSRFPVPRRTARSPSACTRCCSPSPPLSRCGKRGRIRRPLPPSAPLPPLSPGGRHPAILRTAPRLRASTQAWLPTARAFPATSRRRSKPPTAGLRLPLAPAAPASFREVFPPPPCCASAPSGRCASRQRRSSPSTCRPFRAEDCPCPSPSPCRVSLLFLNPIKHKLCRTPLRRCNHCFRLTRSFSRNGDAEKRVFFRVLRVFRGLPPPPSLRFSVPSVLSESSIPLRTLRLCARHSFSVLRVFRGWRIPLVAGTNLAR